VKGALHEAVEEMLQLLLRLALPDAQGFDFGEIYNHAK